LDIRTRTASDGYLVISSVYYPGWKATVDGQPVAVERANSVIAALPLPKGEHQIRYWFDPLSVKIGLAMTAASWLIAAAVLVSGAFRRRGWNPVAQASPR
jgi:uncharacterized membrane protein YfhO